MAEQYEEEEICAKVIDYEKTKAEGTAKSNQEQHLDDVEEVVKGVGHDPVHQSAEAHHFH
eukprot:CAMPEP_0184365142 /NCGR_PEP_ID=MMETSP1089-20130417/147425_1 /TAXON_ID=38269 ORGANISM="Gloeochaete wittrockiana, Strain SAG46.84" /NCGR_SAMPLE_ID=MMETSP1089 /ASSEMBLY_ACC=CAM_ASM_000445 /LENGTH=59 /DNA_ID=CAMNT_0026706253 /DNA_START=68 /DNA_END=244 /DNA_ORIENTATION=+